MSSLAGACSQAGQCLHEIDNDWLQFPDAGAPGAVILAVLISRYCELPPDADVFQHTIAHGCCDKLCTCPFHTTTAVEASDGAMVPVLCPP